MSRVSCRHRRTAALRGPKSTGRRMLSTPSTCLPTCMRALFCRGMTVSSRPCNCTTGPRTARICDVGLCFRVPLPGNGRNGGLHLGCRERLSRRLRTHDRCRIRAPERCLPGSSSAGIGLNRAVHWARSDGIATIIAASPIERMASACWPSIAHCRGYVPMMGRIGAGIQAPWNSATLSCLPMSFS
jgi:hypothetical protein